MFKLVVLCSVLAAAVAKPGLVPYAYGTYFTPTTYTVGSPLLATGYSSPYLHGAPLLPAAHLTYSAPAHLIKKRSVRLAPLPAASYIAPAYSAPLAYSYPSTYHATTYTSYPSYLSSPYAYSSHYIKKRSVPLAVSTYLAPAAVSHQSRLDVHSSAPIVTSYASPYLYSSPLAYSHYYK